MSDRQDNDETIPTVAVGGARSVSVGRDVTNSNIFTGDIKIETPVTTALHQLRAPVGDFVGREKEIETLINALRRESRACITGISGMDGIGKTELINSASALKPSNTPNRHSPFSSRLKIPTLRKYVRNLPNGASNKHVKLTSSLSANGILSLCALALPSSVESRRRQL